MDLPKLYADVQGAGLDPRVTALIVQFNEVITEANDHGVPASRILAALGAVYFTASGGVVSQWTLDEAARQVKYAKSHGLERTLHGPGPAKGGDA